MKKRPDTLGSVLDTMQEEGADTLIQELQDEALERLRARGVQKPTEADLQRELRAITEAARAAYARDVSDGEDAGTLPEVTKH